MALMLIVLIAMAGFGVDVWNWWYTSQKVQRAADAGALAGVPFMPADIVAATSTAQAVVKQNGYPTASVVQGVKPNQLIVTVDDTVNNYFTSLLGLTTTNIARSATAEFNAPVAMGSPVGHLANDPDNGASVDQHWLNIGAPGVDKHTGDRFADFANCSAATYLCPAGGTNSEYLDSTYIYTVDIPSVGGNGVDIQVYDPEMAVGNQNCDNQWLTSGLGSQIATLTATYPDAAVRYAGGQNNHCTGDDNTNLGAGKVAQATAWLVRDSKTSMFQGLQNKVVSTGGPAVGGATACAHQFKGYDPNDPSVNNPGTYWFDLLNPGPSQDPDFAASFHRWYTMCHITTPGRYFIQVRSNVPYSVADRNTVSVLEAPHPNPDTSLAGQNRYSIRVVDSGPQTVTANAQAFALSRLPVYTNTKAGQNPTFYLARLVPGGGTTGRTLHLTFYDIGDVSGITQLDIIPPNDSPQKANITCGNWVYNGDPANPTPSGVTPTGCRLSGITSANYPGGNNGALVDVNVKTPPDYTCGSGLPVGVNDPNACWFTIKMTYASGSQANDTTTWAATIGGDPVRLVK